MNLCIYEAMDRIPLGIAVTIEFWGPLAVAVAGSRRPLDLLWVALAAGGIVLLADPGGSLDTVGVAFALAAGGLWAGYILLSARVGAVYPGGSGLAIAMVFGALVTLPAGLDADLLEPEILAAGAVIALASSVIPYSFELEALRRLPARVFGVLMSLEPAVRALRRPGARVRRPDVARARRRRARRARRARAGARLREWLAIGLVVVASAGVTAETSTAAG